MEEMIGYCGYNCHMCAARSDDPEVRQKMVDGWRKIYGHQDYTAENVYCPGCLADGDVADKKCKARPCAKEKGVQSCTECDEFPCDRMKHLMASREGLLIYCCAGKEPPVTAEEYNLCCRQFESMPNLVGKLAAAGKIPSV
jgi:hypothetical protein